MKNVSLGAAVIALVACLAVPGAHGFSQDSLVWQKCTGCHEPSGGKIPRVEDIRTTPEEWTAIVDRMRRLYGMDLGKGEMGRLLKELASTQSLTPAEQAEVAYLSLWNNPQVFEAPSGGEEEQFFAACVRCHSAGKVYSYRMTPESWAKVKDLHLYVVPTVIYQLREMHWLQEADTALAYLAREYPYGRAWQSPQRNFEGTYAIVGREPGKGAYQGEAKVTSRGNGEFGIRGELRYDDGTSEVFKGDGTLYGGYALRTRTTHNGFETRGAYILAEDGSLSGDHHFPAPHFRTSQSRWYPASGGARVLRVSPDFLVAGEETVLRVAGVKLPEVAAGDVVFSGGAPVEVRWAKRVAPDAIEIRAVYRGSRRMITGVAQAELKVKGLAAGTVNLTPGIDYIAITPAVGMARLDGGPHYPAEGLQFEAIAYSLGADVSDPGDDVALGPVDARFHLAEEVTRPGDDDLDWLGAIEPDGTYLPTGDYAPITAREYSGDGSGWVKVVATYGTGEHLLIAEAKLAVTVPDYIQRIR